MFRLIPREEKFFDMFSDMAQNVHEASKLLRKMTSLHLTGAENRMRSLSEIESRRRWWQ